MDRQREKKLKTRRSKQNSKQSCKSQGIDVLNIINYYAMRKMSLTKTQMMIITCIKFNLDISYVGGFV